MKLSRQREIIIEFERVQIVRKRAKTHLRSCLGCQTNADFVLLHEAASLFNSTANLLFQFIKDTESHYQTDLGGGIFICLNSLLANMRNQSNGSKLKLIESGSNG